MKPEHDENPSHAAPDKASAIDFFQLYLIGFSAVNRELYFQVLKLELMPMFVGIFFL
jgi:hypothetical protein